MAQPFDAVLVVAFGGPQGPADVRPFLENVLRGRRVPASRIDEVAHHYDRFGGVSPLTELTFAQARALEAALHAHGVALPVYVGMRNWDPYLRDTLERMARSGVRRAIGVLAAAQRSYSGCLQYRENVRDALVDLRAAGTPAIDVTYIGDWHTHPGFIDANAANVRDALLRLPEGLRSRARVIFTAHSIPVSMAQRYPYERQLHESARLVADALGRGDWTLVFQSRSGRPEDPWLAPDVCDYLRTAPDLDAVVLSPIGFLCDHIEVLYDLDVEAAAVCRERGLPMARADAVNAHPAFIAAMRDAVLDVWERYRGGRPLKLVNW